MTSNAGERILGTLGVADGKGVVRMEDRFDTDVDDLWSALTQPERLARWLGDVEGDLHLSGAFRAHFFASGWEGTGRVEHCEQPKRLVVSTLDSDGQEAHTISAELAADGDATVLVVEERGMPIDHLAGYGAGIQIHVEDLGAHLQGRDRIPRSRWDELMPAYRELAAQVR
jgi:uncharacterized protein YndB with AHSA1/START domain